MEELQDIDSIEVQVHVIGISYANNSTIVLFTKHLNLAMCIATS